MNRLKTSLKGILSVPFFSIRKTNASLTLCPISTKGQAMSGHHFLARVFNP